MKVVLSLCFAGAVLAGTFAGCRTAAEPAKDAPAAAGIADPAPNLPRLAGTEPEFRRGREMGEALLAAIRNNDEKAFEAAIPPHLRKRPGQAKAYLRRFQAGLDRTGPIRGAEYLGCLDQTVVHDHIWKVTFEVPVIRADNGQKELFRRTRLFQVSVVPMSGKLTVGNFRFQ